MTAWESRSNPGRRWIECWPLVSFRQACVNLCSPGCAAAPRAAGLHDTYTVTLPEG